jgi:RNAse (barnase) inhibitor barstar
MERLTEMQKEIINQIVDNKLVNFKAKLDPDEKKDLKDYMHTCMAGYHAKVDAQNLITNNTLKNIEIHLNNLNGKVAEHERIINERALVVNEFENHIEHRFETCPQEKRIRNLEDTNLSTKSVKKVMGAMFAGGIALGGLIISIIKLITG